MVSNNALKSTVDKLNLHGCFYKFLIPHFYPSKTWSVYKINRFPINSGFISTSGDRLSSLRVFILIISFFSSQVWAQVKCENLFLDQQLLLDRQNIVEQNLFQVHASEVAQHSSDEIRQMNLKTLASIHREIPIQVSADREVGITESAAQRLINLAYSNPIAHPRNTKYDPDGNIGFCFGRAAFFHLMLLKMGVQKNSIRKIWAVGSIEGPEIDWGFHVATMVYSESKGWLVLDTTLRTPVSPENWIQHFSNMNKDEKLRFYVSDASKFSVPLGKYSRVQLGIGMAKDQDFYLSYFTDMMQWMNQRKISKEAVVTEVREIPEKKSLLSHTMSDFWKSFIKFWE